MRGPACLTLGLVLIVGLAVDPAGAARRRHEAVGFQLFTSPQANPIALSPNGSRLYVANTTSRSVSVVLNSLRLRRLPVNPGSSGPW